MLLSWLACLTMGFAQQVNAFRIALRMDAEHVLIIGSELPLGADGTGLYADKLRELPVAAALPKLVPADSADSIYLPLRADLEKLAPGDNWRTGERWSIYPGAGTPVAVTIEKPGFTLYCGGPGGYRVATARITGRENSNRLASLLAQQYLATKGGGIPAIGHEPLMPIENLDEFRITEILRERVANAPVASPQIRMMRWNPAGKPLLLVQALWLRTGGGGGIQIDAVIDEKPMQIIAASTRVSEPYPENHKAFWSTFLNGWKIGSRLFLLVHDEGTEGFGVHLVEVIPGGGFVDVGPGYGAGC